MVDAEPYNPLAKGNLGVSVAEALLKVEILPLSDTAHLVGAGVYAIYYIGRFPLYRPLRHDNSGGVPRQPIYVGKAIPKGARKGGLSFDAGRGRALRDRLRQHAASIEQAANLRLTDFSFRSLVVDDVWIPLGESVLIERFQPIWNRVIDGFGNKDPGNRRATQYMSSWDVLHEGRSFAKKLAKNPLTVEAIAERIERYFEGRLAEHEKLRPEDEA